MAKASYWQRGESLDYKNGTDAVIEANTVVDLTTRIGIVGTTINPGEVGSLHVVGVYQLPKTGTAEIAMGAAVTFDGSGITTGSGTPAGYAAATAAAGDTTILVKLLG